MKKIKIYTNHYFPENFRINEISEYLSKTMNISVITQTPNYPQGVFCEGYGVFKKQKEMLNDIKIRRLPVIPRGKNSITLMLNYLSYILSSTIYSLFNSEEVDYVFSYITSPIFISWAAIRTAKKNNVPHILYLLDLWPDSLFSILNIKNKIVQKWLRNMCMRIYNRSDIIMISSASFYEILVSYGVDQNKIIFVPQHAESINYKGIKFKKNDKTQVVFTGNIGEAQGLDVLVDCARILLEENYKNVKFKIVGDGRYKTTLENNVVKAGVSDYFEFVGRVDSSLIPCILRNSHFGFLPLKDEPTFNNTLPAKLQTYMSEGIPIIGCANGEIPRVIEEAQCGFSVGAGDAQALAELIMELENIEINELANLGARGIAYAVENYERNKLFSRIENIISNAHI